MITISLCMIVKNEENVLKRCLESVKDGVDEIIIVDTGSKDRTKEIAADYTDQIFDFEWIDDFSAARNFAFSKATMDYQFWLDADDVLRAEEVLKLIELKQSLPEDTEIVTMKYNVHFDELGNPVFSSRRERLLRRNRNYRWNDPVHECIPLIGKVFNSEITIDHHKEARAERTDRNLKIYEALEKSGKEFNPRQMYYYARELFDHRMIEKSTHYFKAFLDTNLGWVEDNIAACNKLAACYNQLGAKNRVLPALLKSFEFDSPRAEILCEIGYYYKTRSEYKKAIDWFTLALAANEPENYCFFEKDYTDFIPHLELCVCYFELGDLPKAVFHNQEAGKIKPHNQIVASNQKFFEGL